MQDALWHGKVVGRVLFQDPELNFVDSGPAMRLKARARGRTLAEIVRDLFPFKINSAIAQRLGSRAFNRTSVDVYPQPTRCDH